MAYATLAELKARLGSNASPPGLYEQLTDRVSGTTANDAVGQALLDEAAALVDAYLARRYAVPIDASGDALLAAWLRGAALDLAVYSAWAQSPLRPETLRRVVDERAARIAMLEAIAAGRADLPAANGAPASASGGSMSATVDGGDVRLDRAEMDQLL